MVQHRDDLKLMSAIEEFRATVQHVIFNVMKEKGITKKQLSEALECSPPNISQLLGEDSNPTLESLARVFYALGDTPQFSSTIYAKAMEKDADEWGSFDPLADELTVPVTDQLRERIQSSGRWERPTVGAGKMNTSSAEAFMEMIELVHKRAEGSAHFTNDNHEAELCLEVA